jgi:hypothetical protein
MDEVDFDAKWDHFLACEGGDIETEVAENLSRSRHLLDMHDGTHASWDANQLGVLLVFGGQDACDFIGAWHDADDGNLMALAKVLDWVNSMVGMIEQCVAMYGTTDFDLES